VGLPDYQMDIWFGLVAPRATPRPIVEQINGYMRDMVADAAMRERIVKGFMRPVSMSVDDFTAFMKEDIPRWQRIIRESGAVAD
jgi:tripartite-type tricarboxylate transporter receptor subunit TctC